MQISNFYEKSALQMYNEEGNVFNIFVRPHCVIVSNTESKQNYYLFTGKLYRVPLES